MIALRVMDMFSCRSIGAITKSVKALDSEAKVRIDVATSGCSRETEDSIGEGSMCCGQSSDATWIDSRLDAIGLR